jgi:hypothetical protein
MAPAKHGDTTVRVAIAQVREIPANVNQIILDAPLQE